MASFQVQKNNFMEIRGDEMFRFSLLFISVIIGISGCATVSNTPLTQDASMQLQGKSVIRTTYPTADFAAFTAGKAAFAMIGAAAMIAEGNKIVRENEITDPAVGISHALGEKLITAREARPVESASIASSDDIPALITAYPGADYLLDVKTFNWMFNYYPTDWAHYKVTYSARLRLIDAASKKVIAETMCQTVQGDDNNPPTKDQLLENRAALLKDYLNKATTACSDLLAKEILKL